MPFQPAQASLELLLAVRAIIMLPLQLVRLPTETRSRSTSTRADR
jgi:hypothetical protein